MDIVKQCEIWDEKEEYQKIIDALEGLPEAEQTPDLVSELARAYNNLANPGDTAYFRRAIELLESVEEHFEGDHRWNFRMAYAYYYLDEEGMALPYFEKALEASPGDADTERMIEDCRARLAVPHFEKTFRERVAEGWAAFSEGEHLLRALIDQKDQAAAGETLVAKCNELLSATFADVSFELGFNGQKYELILTPEGSRAKLFSLVYFQKHAPAALLERWNILVGRRSSGGFALRAFEQEISGEDVQVWVTATEEEELERRTVSLRVYCEKLLSMQREDEGKVWWMLTILLDQIIGEIPAMMLVDDLTVLEAPESTPRILLEQLPEALEKMGLSLSADANSLLENGYSGYRMEPNEDVEADLRLDVFAGSTCLAGLINEYLDHESDLMNAFHRDGAVPGFLYYSLESFAEETDRGAAVLDFRDALEAAILEAAGEDAVTFLGGASGIYCGYLDLIAWDLPAVLNAAQAFFAESELEWASFHTFRRDVGGVSLKRGEGDEEEMAPPEMYTEEQMALVEEHISEYFGEYPSVWHEIVSPDIHVDICFIPPTEERDYYTLVTMGMGAHRMNVPESLAEHKLERAELVIALPSDWKIEDSDERWYWPTRLLKQLARLPGACDTWLGWGHTVDNQDPFAEDTDLCGSILLGPQDAPEGAGVCELSEEEEINFYQVIPIYREEMEYKQGHDAEALFGRMPEIPFVVEIDRDNFCEDVEED